MDKILYYAKQIFNRNGFEKGCYFLFYACLHYRVFQRWFNYMEKELPSCLSANIRRRLAMRPAYRYLRTRLTPAEKIDIFIYYYNALKARFSSVGVNVFLNIESHQMVEFTGKSGRRYAIFLLTETTKDGALKFQMMDMENYACLAKITGTLGINKVGDAVFWIGSMQGASSHNGKEDIAEATKDLNGLRPKQAVFYAACALAEWFGATIMLGPSLDNQIAMKVFYRKHKVFNDYKSFWEEFVPISPDGDYHIPLPVPRRDVSQVPSKRRKDWVLRYERIDAISAGIRKKLNDFMKM